MMMAFRAILFALAIFLTGTQVAWGDHNPNHGGGSSGSGDQVAADSAVLSSSSIVIDLGQVDLQGSTAYGGSDDRVVVSNSIFIEGSRKYDFELVYPSLCGSPSSDDRLIFSPTSGTQVNNFVVLAGLQVVLDGASTLFNVDPDTGATSGNPNQFKCVSGNREIKIRNRNISGSSDTIELYVTFRVDGGVLSTSAGLGEVGENGEIPAGTYQAVIDTTVTFKGS